MYGVRLNDDDDDVFCFFCQVEKKSSSLESRCFLYMRLQATTTTKHKTKKNF